MKRVAKILFLCLVILLFTGVGSVLRFKDYDGIQTHDAFYRLPDESVDVLMIGSSHAYMNYIPAVLWEQYGYSSFTLGGSAQPMWNSYYDLVEALKTQTPDVILLEGFLLCYAADYGSTMQIVKNVSGYRPSQTKLENYLASVPREELTDYVPEIMRNHSRYSVLSYADFRPNEKLLASYKGYPDIALTTASVPQNTPVLDATVEDSPLLPKTEQYYRMILELAQSKSIPIMVVITPFPAYETYMQANFHYAAKIAESYGVPFLNLAEMPQEVAIDYQTHCIDTDHLNYTGASIVTEYLGAYLSDHYNLQDHRGDERYASWDTDAAAVTQVQENAKITRISSASEWLSKTAAANPEGYLAVVSVNPSNEEYDGSIAAYLAQFGLEELLCSDGGIAVIRDGRVISCYTDSELCHEAVSLQGEASLVISKAKTADGLSVCYNRQETILPQAFLNVLLYDEMHQTLVDTVGVSADGQTLLR